MLHIANSYNMVLATSKLSYSLYIHNMSHNLHHMHKIGKTWACDSHMLLKAPWKSIARSYSTILLNLLIVGNLWCFWTQYTFLEFLHPPKIQINILFPFLLIQFIIYKILVVAYVGL
jgi:hypothetical protein